MKTLSITIDILSYWQVGDGSGRGGEADSVVLKTPDGLPFLPGRSVKGLLREAVLTLEEAGRIPAGTTDRLFGKQADPDSDSASTPALLLFENAVLEPSLADYLLSDEGRRLRPYLFTLVASTAVDDHGVAEDHTLRTAEVTLPLTLKTTVTGPERDDDWQEVIKQALPLVRSLGAKRHRGFGRCEWRTP